MDPDLTSNRFARQNVLAELFPPDEEEGEEAEPAAGPVTPNTIPDPGASPPGSGRHAPRPTAVRSARGSAQGGRKTTPARGMPFGQVVAVVNQKGGVGKTTTTINLGAALVEEGARVLLVDFDPQGALSVGLGLSPDQIDLSVYDLLLDRSVSLGDVVLPSKIDRLDLIPSNIDLSAAEVVLVSEVAREQLLKRCLAPARAIYNYILIDCPPSLGLLTVNALTASDSVMIPLECEYLALRGMALLMDTIGKVKERLNPDLGVLGILATMLEARTVHGREVLGRVTEAFGDKLFKTVIHKTIKFSEAPVAGEPILSYAPGSNGAQEYRDLAREVLSRAA